MLIRIGIFFLLLVASIASADDVGWPVEIDAEGGWTVTLYQPQVDGLEENDLQSRAAVSVTGPGVPEPVFGAVWITARLEVDRTRRVVQVVAVEVPDVRFPEASEEGKRELARLLEREIPTWDLEISLDRFIASLETVEDRPSVAGLKHDPPVILWSQEPAVLVTIDGTPELRKNPWLRGQRYDVLHVANTPFPILYDERGELYYLYGGGNLWYRAKDVMGPWTVTGAIPSTVKFQIPEELRKRKVDSAVAGKPPRIIVATEPSELIVSDGEPTWADIEGLGLQYVSNADSPVLLDTSADDYFVVLSGRWFCSRSLSGPWEFVPPDQLPPSFVKIPADSPVRNVRAHVAGTQEAREAVLDAQIPHTAAVTLDATIEVKYDGAARFEEIEGTELQYAVNTTSQVIKASGAFYCCEQGVWYESNAPTGPWKVSTEVPEKIYQIPPSNPNHNVTYVHVYDTTPEVVYVGYTMGYLGSYYYNGCTVYGTGWHYLGWYGDSYYPKASTWGFHSVYNPYTGGWGFGVGWSDGPFTITIGVSSWGGAWGGGWFGVGGYYPYYRPYPGGVWVDPLPTRYDYGGPSSVPHYDVYARPVNAATVIADPYETTGQQPRRASGRANDVYADRGGVVYRENSDGSWSRREGGQWRPTEAPTAGSGATTTPASGGVSLSGRTTIEEEAEARRRGDERVEDYTDSGS